MGHRLPSKWIFPASRHLRSDLCACQLWMSPAKRCVTSGPSHPSYNKQLSTAFENQSWGLDAQEPKAIPGLAPALHHERTDRKAGALRELQVHSIT